ncbi:MAG: hypothetical protein A2086_15285 [Spirochaetes bacterium GWD1_27_9]|nr:MAG: hypothetical protein A2Z98_05905 [Spirochaetes bacterium GWB1_27_13]OHD25185.1 MAG: hypothetical protein A2Y34_14985 [Spirochaetes bacterium GWC1_27_15]OHD31259.1 MAG: hypothetical protein A2086_15285 [Spirochaetes bacterium GWD1_27_9]
MNIKYYNKKLNLYIIINSDLLNSIKSNVKDYYPKEVGGVFVGYYNKNEAIITNFIIPNKIENSFCFFKRNVDNINKELKKIFIEENNIYIGEWHSHPNGDNMYSNIDFNTIKKIANDEDVKIENPLLLIVGFNNSDYFLRFYVYKNEELLEYEQV